MKLSLEWLSEYADLSGLDPEQIALELTMKTAEVEEVHTLNRSLENIFVAEVLSCSPLDHTGKLALVEVGLGQQKLTTVCAAPNLRLGMKSAFAPAGSRIAGGVIVEKGAIAGHESQGILLSPREAGLSDYHDGVLDLPADLNPGTKLASLLPATDYCLEIDNKSITHRPDLWGCYGFARELAAIFNRELKPLATTSLDRFADLPAFPLEVADYHLCPGYSCLMVDRLHTMPATLPMQWRLYTVGLRAINLLVDLTNYIMLETGQPMHAFDGDYVAAIRVAQMGKEADFITLDGVSRKILPADLMIWNQNEPVALAGVMGGLHSEVNQDTKRLLLESANFQPGGVRRTAVRLGLRTDASQRFEKDLPKSLMSLALGRFLSLCAQAGQEPTVRSSLSAVGDLGREQRRLTLPKNYINRYIGEELPPSRILSILENIGFACELNDDQDMRVTVPDWRSERDVSVPQDIVEEVARFYGYDNITPVLPTVAVTEYPFDLGLLAEHKTRRFLSQSRGFMEAHTYSWFDDRWLAKISYDPGETLLLKNPTAPYKSRLRTTLLPNLLELIPQNYAQRDHINIYELGHVYEPDGPADSCEYRALGILSFQVGRNAELENLFRRMKGLLEDLWLVLGLKDLSYRPVPKDISPWILAGSALELQSQGRPVGALGYLTGPIMNIFKRNALVTWLEMRLGQTDFLTFPKVDLAMPSIYPGSWLDFSIVWPRQKGYARLEQILSEFKDPLLLDRKLTTMYHGQGLEKGQGSYTFRFDLGLYDRTLTKEDIDGFQENFMAFLQSRSLVIRA